MKCNRDETAVGGNLTVAVPAIQSKPYESPQYSFVDRVCDILERYAIENGAEVLQSSPLTEPPLPQSRRAIDRPDRAQGLAAKSRRIPSRSS
jgi:hypothetical protein